MAATASECRQMQANAGNCKPRMTELACHACNKVHPRTKQITLPDGQTVGSYSQEYKTYCEAKWVYKKAKSRFDYLEAIQKIRGQAAYEQLRHAMLKVHYESK